MSAPVSTPVSAAAGGRAGGHMAAGAPALAPPAIARHNVLGVGVSAVNMGSAVAAVQGWIDRRERSYVCVTGVHGVMESRRDPLLRGVHNRAGLVLPDGMPLAWLLRLGGHRNSDRVCGPEFLPRFVAESVARGDRHFFFGGSPLALERLQAALRAFAPGMVVAGALSPPYRPMTPAEDEAAVAAINTARPDVVWVGLSTPKQERWMADHRDRLEAPALIGVGAAFDIQAGLVRRAPRFLRRTGLEWTYRLMLEPRRLWRRYAASNPLFVVLAAAQQAGVYRPLM